MRKAFMILALLSDLKSLNFDAKTGLSVHELLQRLLYHDDVCLPFVDELVTEPSNTAHHASKISSP